MRIQLIRALGPTPADIESVLLDLPEGTSVGEAVRRSRLDSPLLGGFAVYGERVTPAHILHDGDRVELLRPLQMDPKQARRRRAALQRGNTS